MSIFLRSFRIIMLENTILVFWETFDLLRYDWIRLRWLHHSPFLPNNLCSIFIYVLSLSTFNWFSNKKRSKYKWTQKFGNVHNFIKCIRNTGQNCITKWTTKCTTCCTIKFIDKIDFSLCFDFVKQAKNKAYIFNWVLKVLVERFH